MQWRHVICFIAALSVTAAVGAPYPSGLSDATIQVAGVVRHYWVHVPVGLSTTQSAIVFALHGGGGAGLEVANTGSHPLSVFRNVAAVAASAGNLPQNPKAGACSGVPTRRVPILMAHGTADVPMPYAGGCVANFGGACNRGRVISAQATRDWWLNANGLSGVSPTQTVVDLDTTDGGPANRFAYAGTAPVEWWRLNGAGHTVASRTVLVSSSAERGVQNRDIEFADVAWAFFKSRLAATAAAPPSAAALRTEFTVGSSGRSVRPTPLRDSFAGFDVGSEWTGE